jgi:hypothetical protein
VQAVYPEAVTQHTEVVPSILEQATSITQNTDGTLLLVVPSAHGLTEHDSVQLSLKPDMDASGNLLLDASGNPTFKGDVFETPVLNVNSPTWFTVAAWPQYASKPSRPVMVVGKRVHDFLSVDEDVLGLLALGGIKEVMAEQEVMKQQHQSTMNACMTLANRFSTLLGLNPGFTMPPE